MLDPKQLVDLATKHGKFRGVIANEQMAKMTLVVPFIELLGYDSRNPIEVRAEFSAEFVQKDGKKWKDKMDFAIFDETGSKPHMVLECKPLGADLRALSNQLARYIGQLANLHFGIMTDGCHYLFYGDLETPNIMDPEPFFQFALDDSNADWAKVAKFLDRFSRDTFNADTLVTDAENAKYRQAMIDKLAQTLRAPQEDEVFLKWLTEGIYKGKRTTAVMSRLSEVARDAVEPALLKVVSDDFVERLRSRLMEVRGEGGAATDTGAGRASLAEIEPEPDAPKKGIVTTEEELALYEKVKEICVSGGASGTDILWKDTINYFIVSYKKPNNWFIRFFSGPRKKSIVTMLDVEELRALCPGLPVEAAPPVFGTSRVFIEDISKLSELSALILKCMRNAATGA